MRPEESAGRRERSLGKHWKNAEMQCARKGEIERIQKAIRGGGGEGEVGVKSEE